MNIFYLMHRDDKTAAFATDSDSILSFRVNENCRSLLPYGVQDVKSFVDWLKNRAIPAARYATLGNDLTRLQFLLSNNSLSLCDSYWTCPLEDSLRWGEVNLYDNSFESSIILDSFGELADSCHRFTPSSSLKGDLAKKWVIDQDGSRVLVKGSHLQNNLQAVTEVLATAMYSACNVDFVKYSLITIICNGEERLGCKCGNFTSLNSEFIPAIDIMNLGKKMNSESWYSHFISVCNEHLLNVQDFMDVMFCIDFLIANCDRHLNNFGILRDPVSLRWKSMAPVFDSGNSLFYRNTANSSLPKGKELLEMPVNSFYKTASKQLKCVSNRGCVSLDSLPSLNDLEKIIRMDRSLTDFDVMERTKVLEQLRTFFEDFQNGAEVWSYKYQKGITNAIRAF